MPNLEPQLDIFEPRHALSGGLEAVLGSKAEALGSMSGVVCAPCMLQYAGVLPAHTLCQPLQRCGLYSMPVAIRRFASCAHCMSVSVKACSHSEHGNKAGTLCSMSVLG